MFFVEVLLVQESPGQLVANWQKHEGVRAVAKSSDRILLFQDGQRFLRLPAQRGRHFRR